MRTRLLLALLGLCVLASASDALAQDDEPAIADEPLKCLSMASVRSTKIIDDDTVLFFAGRGRVYLNRLERECVGLARAGKFTFQVQTGARHARLCATDSITVLERTGRGFNCGLGMFKALSSDEADGFLLGPNRAVTSTPVEAPQNGEPRAPAPGAEPPPTPPP